MNTYKVEVLTADTKGLAAFVRGVKQVRLRQRYPLVGYDQMKKKVRVSYDEFIERLVDIEDAIVKENRWLRRNPKIDHAIVKSIATRGLTIPAVRPGNEDIDTDGLEPLLGVIHPPLGGPAVYYSALNRAINEGRVEEYKTAMSRGQWWFTPDPCVVTDDGYIINGQHRLLAAERCRELETAPQFVVVWGVDKRAALLMDEARRTGTDRREIALRFASAGK